MPPSKGTPRDDAGVDPIVAEVRRHRAKRDRGYRERALKLFPPICAHCGREFEGRELRMLTVHHKDHDHDNNPPDGSNWELLCLYCHDNQHARSLIVARAADAISGVAQEPPVTHQPFANLKNLLKGSRE